MGLEFYIIDVEATGLSAQMHEVCEVSIIRCKDRVQLTEFIKCETPWTASYDALRITNKTLADLETGNTKESSIEKIDKFLSLDGLTPAHRCFIAHNASYDKKMIHALYKKVNKLCPVDLWMCSMALTKAYAKKSGLIVKSGSNKTSFRLEASCNLLGVKRYSGAHASKVDTRNTYLLWKALVEDKKVDYLPFIKTYKHTISNQSEYNDDVDMSILED